MSTADERWLSVEEIAEHLGVTKDSIYRWIERRSLPAHRVGKLWKFKRSEVDEWVRTGRAAERREGGGQGPGARGPFSSPDPGPPTPGPWDENKEQ